MSEKYFLYFAALLSNNLKYKKKLRKTKTKKLRKNLRKKNRQSQKTKKIEKKDRKTKNEFRKPKILFQKYFAAYYKIINLHILQNSPYL